MNSVWQQLTLTNLSLRGWVQSSYLHRIVGLLRQWRQGSWLMQWADPIALLLVMLIFALAPFVSTTLIGLLLIACGGYWVLLTLSEENQVGITPIHFLVVLYWAIASLATALSPVREAALQGWIKLTLYLLLFTLMARVLRSPLLRSILIFTFLAVALVVSVYGVRQEFFGAVQLATWNDPSSQLAQDTRVYSYLGNPNLLAGYLLPAFALSIAAVLAWRRWLPKLLAVTMVVVNGACIYFTDSRGGWIGVLAMLLIFGLLLRFWWGKYLSPFWRKWLLPIAFGILAGLLAVALAASEPLRLRATSIFVGRQDSSNNFRINVWMAVLDMIRDRPILGIGPGNDAFNRIYPAYAETGYTALSAYSVFLELAVETGIVGLACFLWLLTVTFNQGWMQLQRLRQLNALSGFWLMAAIASMAGMLAHGLVDTVWYRPQISTVWWLMVALVASYYPVLEAQHSAEPEENYGTEMR